MELNWFLIPAILLSFYFLFLPAALWLVDRMLRKQLEQRIFVVKWNKLGCSAAVICWVLYGLFQA